MPNVTKEEALPNVTKEEALPNVTKEEALLLIEGLLADMLMLKTGAWVPDDDSIDASCEAIWRLQEFVEALPCAS